MRQLRKGRTCDRSGGKNRDRDPSTTRYDLTPVRDHHGSGNRAVHKEVSGIRAGGDESGAQTKGNASGAESPSVRLQHPPTKQKEPRYRGPHDVVGGPEIGEDVVLGGRRQEERRHAHGACQWSRTQVPDKAPHAGRSQQRVREEKHAGPGHWRDNAEQREEWM